MSSPFQEFMLTLTGTVLLLSLPFPAEWGNSTSRLHVRNMYSFTKDQPSDDQSEVELFPEEEEDDFFDKRIFNDDFFNALQEFDIGTPGPDGVIKVTLDEDAVRELRMLRAALQSAKDIVVWLLEGNEEFFPSDEVLRRIGRDRLKAILRVAENEFEKTGLPEPSNGRPPFHDRLEQLKERVKRLE